MSDFTKSKLLPKKLCRVCIKKSLALQNLNTKRNETSLAKLRAFCFIKVSLLNYLFNYTTTK